MDLLQDKFSKLRSRKNVMIDGSAPEQTSMYIDSQGNQSKEDPINEQDIAEFYSPEANAGKDMIQLGLNLFMTKFLRSKKLF